MSRGLGRVQRAVLAVLDAEPDEWLSVEWAAGLPPVQHLAGEWTTDEWTRPTRSQVESVRRAITRLCDEDLVEAWLLRVEVPCKVRVPREYRVYADDRADSYGKRMVLHIARAGRGPRCEGCEQPTLRHRFCYRCDPANRDRMAAAVAMMRNLP